MVCKVRYFIYQLQQRFRALLSRHGGRRRIKSRGGAGAREALEGVIVTRERVVTSVPQLVLFVRQCFRQLSQKDAEEQEERSRQHAAAVRGREGEARERRAAPHPAQG
jgi:hypothetical protein